MRRAPGREKHLIIGNHDVTGPGEVRTLGFDAVWSVMTSPGDPPLLWTHYPLRDVPEGHVNVHGHEHGKGRTEVPKIVDWYMDEKSEIDPLITHTMALKDINTAFHLHARQRVDSQRGALLRRDRGSRCWRPSALIRTWS